MHTRGPALRSGGIAVLLLASACAPRGELVEWAPPSVPAPATDSWKGRSEAALLTALGRPSSIRPDGQGGRVYVYTRFERQEQGTDFPFVPSQGFGDPGSMAMGFPKEIHIDSKELATFWIDKDGVIYRERFTPAAIKEIVRHKQSP